MMGTFTLLTRLFIHLIQAAMRLIAVFRHDAVNKKNRVDSLTEVRVWLRNLDDPLF